MEVTCRETRENTGKETLSLLLGTGRSSEEHSITHTFTKHFTLHTGVYEGHENEDKTVSELDSGSHGLCMSPFVGDPWSTKLDLCVHESQGTDEDSGNQCQWTCVPGLNPVTVPVPDPSPLLSTPVTRFSGQRMVSPVLLLPLKNGDRDYEKEAFGRFTTVSFPGRDMESEGDRRRESESKRNRGPGVGTGRDREPGRTSNGRGN